jgi:methylmalonyl-CoA mutase
VRSFESLLRKTAEGLVSEPYYSEDHAGPFLADLTGDEARVFNPARKWVLRQDFDSTVPGITDQIILSLSGGVEAIGLHAVPSERIDFSRLFEGIWIEMIHVHFADVADPEATAACYAQLALERNLDPRQLRGSICSSNHLHYSDQLIHQLHQLYCTTFPLVKMYTADASPIRNSGGNVVAELTYALALGQEWLHQCGQLDISVDDAAAMIQFQFGTDTVYFTEISKYRAFRTLWNEVVSTYGPANSESALATLTAITSPGSFADRDIHTNLLRATTEAMSAILGGADSILVIPCDFHSSHPSPDALRWSRNIPHILREECGLDALTDPARGSWYIETLTRQLAESAWKMFLELEALGGIRANPGWIAEQGERLQVANAAERVRVGVNKYAMK